MQGKKYFNVIIFPQYELQEREATLSYLDELGCLLDRWKIVDKQKIEKDNIIRE